MLCLSDWRIPLISAPNSVTKSTSSLSSICTLFVKLKFNDFQQTTVECVHDSLDLNILCQLLHEGFLRKRMPVRLLGIGIKLKQEKIYEGIQLPLLGLNHES